MADSSKIVNGFFKNIPIRISSSSVTGGRKTVKKEFPNRDTQTIEDLGLQPRVYDLQIVIAPRTSTSDGLTNEIQGYFEYRNSLLSAIEDKDTGILVHPIYGRIENVVATTFTLTENFTEFGRSTVSVLFEVSDDTGIPRQTTTVLSQITTANSLVTAAINTDITNNFGVSTKFVNNFSDAADKLTSIIDSATEATSFLSAAADEIDSYNSFLGEFSADINSLIIAPSNLATSINNLFSNIDGLFGTVENTAKAFKALFGFGNNDEDDVKTTTSGRIERKENRTILNGSMNAATLGYAYLNTSQIEFENIVDIEEAADELEVQYQFIVASGASTDVLSTLTDMRVTVQDFFDEQKLTAKQLTEVIISNTIPARILSYQYYGESESATEIIALNDITDVSFVKGTLEIETA